MKKSFLFTSLALAGFLSLINAEEKLPIEKLLSSKFKTNVKVVSANPLSKSLTLIVIENQGERGMLIVENGEARIFNVEGLLYEPNKKNIELLRGKSREIASYNASLQENVVLDTIKNNKGLATFIGKNPKASTKYLVLDPSCGFCKDKVDSIDEELKKYNLAVIIVAFLNTNSVNRANYYYNNIAKMKTDSDKLALIKQIYNRNFAVPNNEKGNKNTTIANDMLNKARISGVPFSFVR